MPGVKNFCDQPGSALTTKATSATSRSLTQRLGGRALVATGVSISVPDQHPMFRMGKEIKAQVHGTDESTLRAASNQPSDHELK